MSKDFLFFVKDVVVNQTFVNNNNIVNVDPFVLISDEDPASFHNDSTVKQFGAFYFKLCSIFSSHVPSKLPSPGLCRSFVIQTCAMLQFLVSFNR